MNLNDKLLKQINTNLLLEATADEIYVKYYNSLPKEVFGQIIDSDPTTKLSDNKMGRYSKWLLNLYKNDELFLDDLSLVRSLLTLFIQYNNIIEEKDINKYKTIDELKSAVDKFVDGNLPKSKGDRIREIKKQAEKVYEDDEWVIIVPKTEAAAKYYGKGTKWCTSAEYNNLFYKYDDSELYININKKYPGEKYQFHFNAKEFVDSSNNKVILDDINFNQGVLNFYNENNLEIFNGSLEYAIENYDWDMFYDFLHTATSIDFDAATSNSDDGYEFAYEIFWSLDDDGKRACIDDYFEYVLPSHANNRDSEDRLLIFDESIRLAIKLGFGLEDKIYYNMLLVEYIANFYGDQTFDKIREYGLENELKTLDSDTTEQISDLLSVSEYYTELKKYNLDNDRISIKVIQIILDENKNPNYQISVLYKNSGKTNRGVVTRNRLFSILQNYDLFED